jgi:hypothetical protein
MSIFDFISDVARAAVDTVKTAGEDLAHKIKDTGETVADAGKHVVDVVADKKELRDLSLNSSFKNVLPIQRLTFNVEGDTKINLLDAEGNVLQTIAAKEIFQLLKKS